MRILHTSDWHLGQVLFGYDRTDEQRHFMQQLARYARDLQPDALLVSGDIYHTAMPSAATQKMFADGLLDIHRACPQMTIVVTGGNHDSASKLEIDRELWQELGVHVLGRLQHVGTGPVAQGIDFGKHVIAVGPRGAAPVGFVAAVPHVYPQNFPPTDTDDRQQAFFERLAYEAGQRSLPGLPIVLMAHLTVTGCDMTGHDRWPASIGTIEDVPLQALGGAEYDYVALGHIHRAQGVGLQARYSGAPLAVSFDEAYDHSVTLVTIGARGGAASAELLPITTKHPLLTIPGVPVELPQALAALRQAWPGQWGEDVVPYVRLNVLAGAGLPDGAAALATAAAEEAGCRFCTFRLTRPEGAAGVDAAGVTPDELRALTPLDIVHRHLALRSLPESQMDDLMRTVLKSLAEDDRR